MKAFLKIEFKRVVKSWGLWVSIVIGQLISITQYFMMVVPMLRFIDTYKKVGLGTIMPHTVFSKWIGGEAVSIQHFLLFMILPILCVVPWSVSAFNDKKDGIIKNYFIRAPKVNYYSAKCFVNFIIGGLVSVLPFISNLILTSATLPSLIPEVSTGIFAVRTDSMFAELFYSHPYIYVFAYLLIIFVFCGAVSCFSTCIGIWLDNSFSIVIIPFVMHLFLYTICSSVEFKKYAPFHFLDPFQSASSISIGIIFVEVLILLIVSFFLFLWGVRDETM